MGAAGSPLTPEAFLTAITIHSFPGLILLSLKPPFHERITKTTFLVSFQKVEALGGSNVRPAVVTMTAAERNVKPTNTGKTD